MSIVEAEEAQPITYIHIDQDWEWYYYVPLLDRSEWDGIEYEDVKYGWDELDYRFDIEYTPAIPEPSITGTIFGLVLLAMIAIRIFKK